MSKNFIEKMETAIWIIGIVAVIVVIVIYIITSVGKYSNSFVGKYFEGKKEEPKDVIKKKSSMGDFDN